MTPAALARAVMTPAALARAGRARSVVTSNLILLHCTNNALSFSPSSYLFTPTKIKYSASSTESNTLGLYV